MSSRSGAILRLLFYFTLLLLQPSVIHHRHYDDQTTTNRQPSVTLRQPTAHHSTTTQWVTVSFAETSRKLYSEISNATYLPPLHNRPTASDQLSRCDNRPRRLYIPCWRELSRRRLLPAVTPAAGHLTAPTVEGLPGLCENFRSTTSTTSPS